MKATDRPGECPACGLSRVAHPLGDVGCFPSAVALFQELLKAKAEANGAAHVRAEANRLTHALAAAQREVDEQRLAHADTAKEFRRVREALDAVRIERDAYERLLDEHRKRERDDAERLAHLIETRADIQNAIRGIFEPTPTEKRNG